MTTSIELIRRLSQGAEARGATWSVVVDKDGFLLRLKKGDLEMDMRQPYSALEHDSVVRGLVSVFLNCWDREVERANQQS